MTLEYNSRKQYYGTKRPAEYTSRLENLRVTNVIGKKLKLNGRVQLTTGLLKATNSTNSCLRAARHFADPQGGTPPQSASPLALFII